MVKAIQISLLKFGNNLNKLKNIQVIKHIVPKSRRPVLHLKNGLI